MITVRKLFVSIFRGSWKIWLAAVKVLGTIQMVILLTVVYGLFIPLLVIPAGLVADPLKLRNTGQSTWLKRPESVEGIEALQSQG